MPDGDLNTTNTLVSNPTGANNNTATTGGVTEPTNNAPLEAQITLDSVVNFLNTDKKARHEVFYKHFQPELDSQKHQHLDTWKKNNLPGIVQEEINNYVIKNFPQESVEQKRLREVESKLAEKDRENLREKLKNKGMSYANYTSLPIGDNIEWFIGDSEEDTRTRIDWLKEFREAAKREGRNEVMSQHGRTPQGGSDAGTITLDNWKQRLDEGKRKYGLNVMAKDPELKKFMDQNAGKLK